MAKYCFFHSADMDGFASAAIIKQIVSDATLHGINYGDEFPFGIINKEDTVYMVDFCLSPFEDMVKLSKMCNLIWIDHHIGAIRDYESLSKEDKFNFRKGLRDTNFAGCELTWKYMSEKEMPYSIHLLGRYDVWDKYHPNVDRFQYGIKTLDRITPDNVELWSEILSDALVEKLVNTGTGIEKYMENENAKYISDYGFEVEFEGLRGIACNRGKTGSMLFDSAYDPEKHDVMIPFVMVPDGSYVVSLYTKRDDLDLSKIAKKFVYKGVHGGGHAQASGFQCEELPFTHVETKEK